MCIISASMAIIIGLDIGALHIFIILEQHSCVANTHTYIPHAHTTLTYPIIRFSIWPNNSTTAQLHIVKDGLCSTTFFFLSSAPFASFLLYVFVFSFFFSFSCVLLCMFHFVLIVSHQLLSSPLLYLCLLCNGRIANCIFCTVLYYATIQFVYDNFTVASIRVIDSSAVSSLFHFHFHIYASAHL